MKRIKTIGPALFLVAFLLTLLVPGVAFAGACENTDCDVENTTLPCDCGVDTATTATSWCWAEKDIVYSSKADCEADMAGLPPAAFRLATESEAPSTAGALLDRIQVIGNWVFAIFLAMSIIYIVLAAFQFVTGGGDPAQVSAARQKLIYAAVGIAIALLAAGFPVILRTIVT